LSRSQAAIKRRESLKAFGLFCVGEEKYIADYISTSLPPFSGRRRASPARKPQSWYHGSCPSDKKDCLFAV